MKIVTGGTPLQTALPFYGKEISVDGLYDAKREGIQFLGKARHVFDDVYRCLAIVCGTLCLVEVTVKPQPQVGH